MYRNALLLCERCLLCITWSILRLRLELTAPDSTSIGHINTRTPARAPISLFPALVIFQFFGNERNCTLCAALNVWELKFAQVLSPIDPPKSDDGSELAHFGSRSLIYTNMSRGKKIKFTRSERESETEYKQFFRSIEVIAQRREQSEAREKEIYVCKHLLTREKRTAANERQRNAEELEQ